MKSDKTVITEEKEGKGKDNSALSAKPSNAIIKLISRVFDTGEEFVKEGAKNEKSFIAFLWFLHKTKRKKRNNEKTVR